MAVPYIVLGLFGLWLTLSVLCVFAGMLPLLGLWERMPDE